MPMLHLVSPALFEVSPGIQPLEEKARAQAKRLHHAHLESGNTKVASKYERLNQYFKAFEVQ